MCLVLWDQTAHRITMHDHLVLDDGTPDRALRMSFKADRPSIIGSLRGGSAG